MNAGRHLEAIQKFEQSAALQVHYKTLQLLGECLLNVGDVQRAVVPLAAATWLTRQASAPVLLAEALLKLGRLADAERAAQQAIDIMPHYKKAQSLLEEIRAAAQDAAGDE